MNRLIEILTPDKVYHLDLNQLLNPNDLIITTNFLKRDNRIPKKNVKFIKRNYSCLLSTIKLLSFSEILQMYQEYNFLRNYWDQDIINYLITRSRIRLNIKILSGLPYDNELVILNNSYNLSYNFTFRVFQKRYHIVKNLLPDIDLDRYFLGTNIILDIANNYFFRNIDKNQHIWKLYSKDPSISLNNNGQNFYQSKDDYTIYKINNITVIISPKFYAHMGEIFFDTNEDIIYDPELNHILSRPSFYQSLEGPLQPLSCEYQEPLKVYKWEKRKIKPYHMKPKEKFTRCYVCKKLFDPAIIIDRYIDMCLDCGIYNYQKRTKMADLTNKTAFVTGIRQKIGLHLALKLLRCGAKVIGTTRFPHATWYNFIQQPDFNEWKDRLVVYQVDFLNLQAIGKLCQYLREQNINFLINNACQTIRPSSIYVEKINLLENILQQDMKYITCNTLHIDEVEQIEDQSTQNTHDNHDYHDSQMIPAQFQIAQVSQHPIFVQPQLENLTLTKKEISDKDITFNQFLEVKDINIKEESSWNRNIEDIHPTEILEVTIINQTVPTLFVNQVKPTMKGSLEQPAFIINVSALEGQFHCKKTSYHAHTNMCKSALDMLIRTMSEEHNPNFKFYSVNPGFVSGVNPQLPHYPLGAEDGAARILDPLIQFYSGTPLPNEWMKLRNYVGEKW